MGTVQDIGNDSREGDSTFYLYNEAPFYQNASGQRLCCVQQRQPVRLAEQVEQGSNRALIYKNDSLTFSKTKC